MNIRTGLYRLIDEREIRRVGDSVSRYFALSSARHMDRQVVASIVMVGERTTRQELYIHDVGDMHHIAVGARAQIFRRDLIIADQYLNGLTVRRASRHHGESRVIAAYG